MSYLNVSQSTQLNESDRIFSDPTEPRCWKLIRSYSVENSVGFGQIPTLWILMSFCQPIFLQDSDCQIESRGYDTCDCSVRTEGSYLPEAALSIFALFIVLNCCESEMRTCPTVF